MEKTLIASGDTVNGQDIVIVESAKKTDNSREVTGYSAICGNLSAEIGHGHLRDVSDTFRATERIYPPKAHEVMSEKESLHILKGLASDHSELLIEVGQRFQGLEAVIANQTKVICLLSELVESQEAAIYRLLVRIHKMDKLPWIINEQERELHQMD